MHLNKSPVVTTVHTSGQCTSQRTATMVMPLQGPRTIKPATLMCYAWIHAQAVYGPPFPPKPEQHHCHCAALILAESVHLFSSPRNCNIKEDTHRHDVNNVLANP